MKCMPEENWNSEKNDSIYVPILEEKSFDTNILYNKYMEKCGHCIFIKSVSQKGSVFFQIWLKN